MSLLLLLSSYHKTQFLNSVVLYLVSLIMLTIFCAILNCTMDLLHAHTEPVVTVMLQPLQIKSVLAKEGLKGYIYIEAYKQTHVKQAIDGISSLRMGFYKQQVSSSCREATV